VTVLNRLVIGVVGAAGAAVVCVPGFAAAEPEPAPPPLPNINSFAPVKLSEYVVMDNNWYAFSTPDGLTCVLQKSGGYGCSGPIPAAPNGANLVSGGPGAPGFSNTAAPVFGVVGAAKPLPPNSRMSYQTVSCGNDGVVTTCVDSRNQSGFVLSPGGSFILNEGVNPLLDRPEGTNPFIN
jgi:hypothetical protein